jgi:hypothetical protein
MKYVKAKFPDGEVHEFAYSTNKKLVKDMLAKGTIEITYFDKALPKFRFNVWIHPKQGGDDYNSVIEYECSTLEIAEKALRKYLKRVSDVVDDYKLIKTISHIK